MIYSDCSFLFCYSLSLTSPGLCSGYHHNSPQILTEVSFSCGIPILTLEVTLECKEEHHVQVASGKISRWGILSNQVWWSLLEGNLSPWCWDIDSVSQPLALAKDCCLGGYSKLRDSGFGLGINCQIFSVMAWLAIIDHSYGITSGILPSEGAVQTVITVKLLGFSLCHQAWGLSSSHVMSCVSRSVVLDNLWPLDCSPPGSSVHGIFPGRSTGVGCHFLLQGIFPTQGSNPALPYCRQLLYHLSHQGSLKECWYLKVMIFPA